MVEPRRTVFVVRPITRETAGASGTASVTFLKKLVLMAKGDDGARVVSTGAGGPLHGPGRDAGRPPPRGLFQGRRLHAGEPCSRARMHVLGHPGTGHASPMIVMLGPRGSTIAIV